MTAVQQTSLSGLCYSALCWVSGTQEFGKEWNLEGPDLGNPLGRAWKRPHAWNDLVLTGFKLLTIEVCSETWPHVCSVSAYFSPETFHESHSQMACVLTCVAHGAMLRALHHCCLVLRSTEAVRSGRAPPQRLKAQFWAVPVRVAWLGGGATAGVMSSGTALTHGVTQRCTCRRYGVVNVKNVAQYKTLCFEYSALNIQIFITFMDSSFILHIS